jgi:hypothetical protein
MATSGTVSQFTYTQQQVIDHAMRRAGFVSEKVSGEGQIIARETLFTLFGELINIGWPLWTQEFNLLSMSVGGADVLTPNGTVDILHAYWRILSPFRGPATLSNGADGSVLVGGQPNTDVVVPGPNPYLQVNLGTSTGLDTFGVLLGNVAPVTAALQILGSDDGIAYNTLTTLPSTTFQPLTWSYFSLNPVLTAQYFRFLNPTPGSWTLNQLQVGLANSQDIELGLMSIDDYYNLPNRSFSSDQVVNAYVDRQLTPLLKVWPVPNTSAFYAGTITAVMRRYIMDPGSFTNSLELPQRWLEAVIWRLASRLVDELSVEMGGNADQGYGAIAQMQAKQARIDRCEKMAAQSAAWAWAEERTPGVMKMTPNLACYSK